MKRTGFARPAYEPPPRAPVRPATRRAVMANYSKAVEPVAKQEYVRSLAYRMLVAQLPCKRCKIETHSQAAHVPASGKGIKESDLDLFPLCCDRPGLTGCHPLFDGYKLWNKTDTRAQGRLWAIETQREIYASGKWPKAVPVPEFLN